MGWHNFMLPKNRQDKMAELVPDERLVFVASSKFLIYIGNATGYSISGTSATSWWRTPGLVDFVGVTNKCKFYWIPHPGMRYLEA